MKILLTGASGFLGGIIKKNLRNEEIISLGRRPGNSLILDLCTDIPTLPKVDLVIHSAGKAHSVPITDIEKQDFFNINVHGTENLLKGFNVDNLPKALIFISTVAVYGKQSGKLLDEEVLLAAKDPYGLSKIEAEGIISEWCKENNVICTILRLPLLAGLNPPGNLKAMIRGIHKGYYFDIAGGKAKKSIVLAEDVANIIPIAASVGGIYNLTDGNNPTFSELSNLISVQLGKSRPLSIPLWIAKLMGKLGDLIGTRAPINSDKLKKIISDLTFDDSKAISLLGWKPRSVLKHFKIK